MHLPLCKKVKGEKANFNESGKDIGGIVGRVRSGFVTSYFDSNNMIFKLTSGTDVWYVFFLRLLPS